MIVLGERFGNSLGRYCDLYDDYMALMIDVIIDDFAFYNITLSWGIIRELYILHPLVPDMSFL